MSPLPRSRSNRSACTTSRRSNDAVPASVALDAVTGTVAVWQVSSTHQVHRQRWTVADGLTAGSGVHLRRLFGTAGAGSNDVHGDVHSPLVRVTNSVDAVDLPAFDCQVDRAQ